jgi:hypothetical protein
MTCDVDITLPADWFPLGPVPGTLMAAAAAGRDGRAVATMVIRMQHCAGLDHDGDATAVFSAVSSAHAELPTARALRWCAPQTVAVLIACAAPGAPLSCDDLASALAQTVVYAVDSTGSAIRSSSADEANESCLGSTRTV